MKALWHFLPFNGTTCFSSFSENENCVFNVDFCHFWKKGEDFFIRELID